MRHIKLFSALLPLVLACSVSLRAQEAPVYFSAEELPDLIKCLPAPPAKGTPGFRYDEQRYKWGKAQRKDLQRAGQACRDAVWTYDALIDELDGPFGMTLSKDGTPALWFLLDRSLRTIDQIRVEPKAWFHRIRPFEYYKEKTLTGEDEELRGEGSYPSGHTIRSWLVALLLSEINPAAANDIYARAWEYGESRVIAGAHWQTDVDASRVAASIGYSSLQASPVFKEDMARAREEYARLLVGRDFFVPITDVVPDAILEIRYYST
ncbi:MAG: phosphatase PAP2 family protein, partial [Bacteroidales bacterium]|nr:phosphatase PAP2 family protein [Bacteroidales bacterium]